MRKWLERVQEWADENRDKILNIVTPVMTMLMLAAAVVEMSDASDSIKEIVPLLVLGLWFSVIPLWGYCLIKYILAERKRWKDAPVWHRPKNWDTTWDYADNTEEASEK